MKVVLDSKAFEFNRSVVECRTVIYIREIQYEVTNEVTISNDGAEWLAKKLLDAADLWCRRLVLQRTRWVDSMGVLDLKIDYNDMDYVVKAEIWSSSEDRVVCMYFPQESSCRGWHKVGKTLLTFISGRDVTETRESGFHEDAVPAAVNETEMLPDTTQNAGVLGQLDQSRDPTSINEMDQPLDLGVGQGVDDSPNGGARKEAGQADLDRNILDHKQQTRQVDFMVPDLNEPITSADLCESSVTGVATDLEDVHKQQTGQVVFMVPDLNEPIRSVESCQAIQTEVATDLQSIHNAMDLDSSSLEKGSRALKLDKASSSDCFQGSSSGIANRGKETEWNRQKDGNIQTYRRTRGGRNDEKDRSVMFPALIKQQTGRASSKDCLQGSSSGMSNLGKETEWRRWKDGNIQTYRRTKRGRNDDETRNVMFPTLIKLMSEKVTLQ